MGGDYDLRQKGILTWNTFSTTGKESAWPSPPKTGASHHILYKRGTCGTLSSLILETKILDANNVYANQLSFLLVPSLVLLQPGTLA